MIRSMSCAVITVMTDVCSGSKARKNCSLKVSNEAGQDSDVAVSKETQQA